LSGSTAGTGERGKSRAKKRGRPRLTQRSPPAWGAADNEI
jgi:hypothetical protein